MTAPVRQLREKGGQHIVVLAAPKVCRPITTIALPCKTGRFACLLCEVLPGFPHTQQAELADALLGARIAKQLFAKNDVMVVPVVVAPAAAAGGGPSAVSPERLSCVLTSFGFWPRLSARSPQTACMHRPTSLRRAAACRKASASRP